jgi:hypothetical protein
MTSSGEVHVNVRDKNVLSFNTKLGSYTYLPSKNMWKDTMENREESLCRVQHELGEGTVAYLVDSNQMPNAYPRTNIVITDAAYAFEVGATCGETDCDLDTQNAIINSFHVIDEVRSLNCNGGNPLHN